jgi:hypothetical protein
MLLHLGIVGRVLFFITFAVAPVLVTPTSSRAQSLLSVLIDQCSRGNMTACDQANQLSRRQAAERYARRAQQPPSAYEIERRNNWANRMNEGYAAQGNVYNDVYKHQLGRGY